jgi:hypothetical protein
MFDPPSPASPSPPHFLPPFLSLHLASHFSLQSTSFSSLPSHSHTYIYIYTCIRRMGGKKAGGLCGMGMRSRRMGDGEDLPLTVARRPPGWVGRAHNRVGLKKYCDPKVGGWVVTWVPIVQQLWWGLRALCLFRVLSERETVERCGSLWILFKRLWIESSFSPCALSTSRPASFLAYSFKIYWRTITEIIALFPKD